MATTVPAVDLNNIYQSRGYTIGLQLSTAGSAIDVSTSTFQSQLRRYPSSADVAATFTVNMGSAATGLVVLSLTSAETAQLAPGPYRWDVDKVDGSSILPLVKAEVIVEPEVTR